MNRRAASGSEHQVLEEYNNAQTNLLAEKVSTIKGVASQFKLDLEASAAVIDDVDREMSSVSNLIDQALAQLKTVTENENSRNMLYLCVFVVCIFFGLYFFL